MDNLSKKALLMKEIFRQMEPDSILDVIDDSPDVYKASPDTCMVRLRDGRMLLARLDQDNRLQMNEIEGVC